jgi:GH15 family glucan-1,4-alpha-glucosidase
MAQRIDHYALIGNSRTAALVGRNGSIDWLCVPRFDAPSVFAMLVGTVDHGRWLIAPSERARVARRYRGDTLVLETEFTTHGGTVRLVDFMPMWPERTDIVRIVEGVRGRVPMRMQIVFRFGYGTVIPWVRRSEGALLATAGPHSMELRTPVKTRGKGFTTVAEFSIERGDRVPFVLTHFPSHEARPLPIDADAALDATERAWLAWCKVCAYEGRWRGPVMRSLLTLKALTYAPTGGTVAAPTTSLPERLGGVRNWDYRYCWVRDATFTLYAFLLAGYRDEARAWREWLLRAAAGRPQDLQVLYGVRGERQLAEFDIPWLPGYRESRPVRVGNAASRQWQLDVYGEVIDTLCVAAEAGLELYPDSWSFQRTLLEFLESEWSKPDNGIWEVRGPRRHFTHSKVMAWVAADRAIRSAEHSKLEAPLDRWRAMRDDIHRTVCRRGFDASRNTFVQYFGSRDLDASLLLIPIVGFLPPNDPRVHGTIAAVERDLTDRGFVRRYATRREIDGLPHNEALFLPCSFWLADALALAGEQRRAERLFKRLLGVANDVGLLAEEYDPRSRHQLGNFPQALSHVALINTARNLERPGGPSEHRSRRTAQPPPDGDGAYPRPQAPAIADAPRAMMR